MVAKKKKGKKAAKGSKKAQADEGSASMGEDSLMAQIRRETMEAELDRYVILNMKLMNWEFSNFELRVKTSVRLFTIKDELTERHGRIRNLILCKDSFSEENELCKRPDDETKTLEEFGICGAPDGHPPVKVEMFYKFKPVDSDAPLLLVRGNEESSKYNEGGASEEA
mmetsp:Transcript_17646/g.23811  ORF Transcript_17646/g.23811 Transcript_17646/m.23811 type:complete len:168 (-) Transcript_17646:287-790(-)|eukprot:CAMPEP_0185754432 /NCGR_PEP_ID=MMETSP1174-20130828/13075_1 /TAXON_ID=35687 /ORGANISM="Dictyocha speculum, Strain CCMP1381" /LENGTH=167 /DNA_ID=CAMNT_0028432629 /DNA_START=135 /DNA_END=638 /DNA_ORIENTATION=-